MRLDAPIPLKWSTDFRPTHFPNFTGPADCRWTCSVLGRDYRSLREGLEPFSGIRYHPGLSLIMEGRMSLLSSATVLNLVDSMASLRPRPTSWLGHG